jgi:hypothetical protein
LQGGKQDAKKKGGSSAAAARPGQRSGRAGVLGAAGCARPELRGGAGNDSSVMPSGPGSSASSSSSVAAAPGFTVIMCRRAGPCAARRRRGGAARGARSRADKVARGGDGAKGEVGENATAACRSRAGSTARKSAEGGIVRHALDEVPTRPRRRGGVPPL